MNADEGIIRKMVWGLCVALMVGLFGRDAGADGLDFTPYYEPYSLNIEPNAPGYTLPLDVDQIVNTQLLSYIVDVDPLRDLIQANGFAIAPPRPAYWVENGADDLVEACRQVTSNHIPLFVTTDIVLHLYHIQFDETLRDIEERQFIPDITALTDALLARTQALAAQFDGDLREAAQRNVAFLAVARKLMDPNATVPAEVAETVTAELAKIETHAGFADSDIFIYAEDYSQYVPRGHYTRSDGLKRYFKTMMWYGRMAFLLKGSELWGPLGEALISPADARIQTLQAVLLVEALHSDVDTRTALAIWDRIYAVTAFYVGIADDLTPYDYLNALAAAVGTDWMSRLADLTDETTYLELKTELALRPSPRIYGGTGNITVEERITEETLDEVLDKTKGMRLMGQRFIPDSYMFQNLVYPAVGFYTGATDRQPFTRSVDDVRGYPRGLDVMALLGSAQALHILTDDGDTSYAGYWQHFGDLKDEFDHFTAADWNANLYWSWLYGLKALLVELPEGYPNFMRTEAWQRRNLGAALSSWTQLRHDTILYAKQSYTAFRSSRVSVPRGYVEPAPEFYARLLALTGMTKAGLTDMQVLSEEATTRLTGLETLLERLIDLAGKELRNEALSDKDSEYIKALPSTLDTLVLGVSEEGLKTTLVADVHTEALEAKVLEEAVGNVDFIVVACPTPDGAIFLAAGPVQSYYEFKHPMSDRLTDEAWRDLLNSADGPARPDWHQALRSESNP